MSNPFGSGQQAWPADPTMPSTAPAGYTTPTLPNPSRNEPPMTSAEAEARRGQFYELILRQVAQALIGFFPPLGPAFQVVEDWGRWVQSLFGLFPSVVPRNDGTALPNLFSSITDNLDGTVHFIADGINGLVVAVDGVVTSAANALQGALTGTIGTVGGLMNAVIGGLTGALGQGAATPNQVNIATQAAAATLAANTAAILDLQNRNSNLANSGQSKSVDFSLYSDSTSLPTTFTQTYSGNATQNYLGINTGRATFNFLVDGTSTCTGVYNALQTDSDYQLIGATFATLPQAYAPEGSGAGADAGSLWLIGRSNASGSSRVQAQIYNDRIQLSCIVAGVKTIFTTQSWTAKAGSAYYLECGTAGGIRIFRVKENSTVILTYTESGSTSQLGSGFRFCGLGGESYRQFFVGHFGFFTWINDYYAYFLPPQLAAWGFADNTPAALLGKQARWYRANAAGVGMPTGFNMLPNDTFDTTDYNVGGIYTFNGGSNCRVTVSEKGLYEIRVHIPLNGAIDEVAALYKNGTLFRRADRSNAGEVCGVFGVNLEPDDYINPGCYIGNGGFAAFGEAAGTICYLEIVKLGSV